MPIGQVKATDPGLTPTEKYRKHQLMRQFVTDGPKGTTDAYRNSPIWCSNCERRFKKTGEEMCGACLEEFGQLGPT